MNRTVLTLVLSVLTAGAAVGQSSSIDVATANGTVALNVRIVNGSGEKIARASTTSTTEPDGVMVIPVPESSFVLRTEHFKKAADVTSMVPAGSPNTSPMSADSVCTSRWKVGDHEHLFVSSVTSNENAGDWSRRHAEGFALISSVYAPTGTSAMPAKDPAETTPSRDQARTNWTDASGIQHEVSTTRRENEEHDAWLARHRQSVKAFTAVMPPRS